jgi:hypothetical protein
VVFKFVGDRGNISALSAAVEGVPLSKICLRLQNNKVQIISATSVSGHNLLTHIESVPIVATQNSATTPTTDQLTPDQKKWLSRQARVLEFQHHPAGILSEAELLSAKATGEYPASAIKHLSELDESFRILFQSELKKDAPKSAKAGRPSWSTEFLKLARSLKDNLDTPSPYLDALLTVLDPHNTKYRSMAGCPQMKAFLRDCSNLGLMPNVTEAGRAKIVIKPVIDRLLSSIPPKGAT